MHESVLLQESVSALKIDAGGIYVDGTFGRGGHSSAILEQLGPDGILIAFDKDPSAIEFGALQFANDARLVLHHGSFAEIGEVVARLGKNGMVGGILLDLGVSSPQLDEPGRATVGSKLPEANRMHSHWIKEDSPFSRSSQMQH